jgi:hypothetical protein
MKNGNAHTSISIDVVARVANVFLERASRVKNEEFFPWDGDDVVGVCINLIDQVPPSPIHNVIVFFFCGGRDEGQRLMVGVCQGTDCDGEKDFSVTKSGAVWVYKD